MSTKADLEKEVKRLKSVIRDIKKDEKEIAKKTEEMDNIGYGVFLDEDDKFNLVKFQFDVSSKSGVISEVTTFGKSAKEAVRRAQLTLGKHITEINKRR